MPRDWCGSRGGGRAEGPGVVYDALGINGARARAPARWDWAIVASNLRAAQPDLIIVAYGSNEVTDPDLDRTGFAEQFAELLGGCERLRRPPRCS